LTKTRVQKSSSRQFISFFSGALGLDIGLHRGGLQALAINEFDSVACRTVRANLERVFGANAPHVYECDIRALTPDELCEKVDLERE